MKSVFHITFAVVLVPTMFVMTARVGGSSTVSTGTVRVNPKTLVTHNDKSQTGMATFTLEDNDLFDMSSFIFTGGMGTNNNNADDDSVHYVKIQSTRSTTISGTNEIAWHGMIASSTNTTGAGGGGGFATLLDRGQGYVVGMFSTATSTYELDRMPNGNLQLRSMRWEDAPGQRSGLQADEDGSVYRADQTKSIFRDSNPTVEGSIVPEQIREHVESSYGPGTSFFTSVDQHYHNRSRSMTTTAHRLQRQSMVVVDVLVLVTNRAMCEAAGLPPRCPFNANTSVTILNKLFIAQEQTTNAMQTVGANVTVRFSKVSFLRADGLDGNPGDAFLLYVQGDANIARWRDEAGADLVAVITGMNPPNSTGPGGQAAGNHSVTNINQFYLFLLTHEIGHNFGCRHERAQFAPANQHPYAHAWQVPGKFRSVMAYPCPASVLECPLVPYFSSDRFSYLGTPLGNATNNNARIIQENAPIMAAYKTGPPASALTAPPTVKPTVKPTRKPTVKPTRLPTSTYLTCGVDMTDTCNNNQNLMHKYLFLIFCREKCVAEDVISRNRLFGWRCGRCWSF